MKRCEIIQELDSIVATIVNHHDFVLSSDLRPENVTGWDSLANAMIITSIQETFGIKMKFVDITSWHNIGQLVDLIEKKTV